MPRKRNESSDQDAELKAAWKEVGNALYICFHDGHGDPNKPPWEQDYAPVKAAWRRLIFPKHRETLQRMLGRGGTPEGERRIQEAFRQACENAKPF